MQQVHPIIRTSRIIPLFIAALLPACTAETVPAPAAVAANATLMSDASEATSLTTAGRKWIQAFYDGHTAEMYAQMGPGLRKLNGSEEGLSAFRDKVAHDVGKEVEVISERTEVLDGHARYVRIARFDGAPVPVRVSLAFGVDGRIVYFLVKTERS